MGFLGNPLISKVLCFTFVNPCVQHIILLGENTINRNILKLYAWLFKLIMCGAEPKGYKYLHNVGHDYQISPTLIECSQGTLQFRWIGHIACTRISSKDSNGQQLSMVAPYSIHELHKKFCPRMNCVYPYIHIRTRIHHFYLAGIRIQNMKVTK